MAEDADPTDDLRRLATELTAAHPGLADPDALRADARLLEGVRLLDEVPPKRVARLIARELPAVVAIAAVAVAKAPDGPGPRITRAALARLRDLPPAAGCLLLEALAASGAPFLTAGVLPALDEAWLDPPRVTALVGFLRERIRRGEEVRAKHLDHVDERFADRLEQALPADLADDFKAAFAEWRASLVDVAHFEQVGRMVDLTDGVACTPAGGRAAAIEAIERALRATPPRSVLLVGEHGVGKATVARAALARLQPDGWRAFEAGAAEVNAGMSYVGQLEERVQDLARRMKGRRLAWLFPQLEAAIWAGQHNRSERGLLDALLPHVEATDMTVVGQLEPRAYEQLARLRPQAASAFEVVRLQPLDPAAAGAVAREWLAAHQLTAAPQDETVEEAVDLAGHYLAGVAAPGSVLRLFRLAAERAARAGERAITPDGLLATISSATGLPLDVLDPRTRLDLAAVRRFFAERVLGQPEAVDCLVERIALVKAGLTDPTRPLGVFLFVGPTGTGKTEIAKALAEHLFGSVDRLVRLDMTEFQTRDALERLLADTSVAGEGAPLISAVRAHPFSVVLLDEFEKAHPSIWDLFLQVFDDGRLTDRGGRTTDFRHCVIILTSNVGSALPSGPGLGFAGDGAPFHAAGVERAVGRAFRPELLNRFDRVVVFRPLGRDVMRALLRHELEAVLDRRGFRLHPWAVEWDDAALDFLLERGFTAELGARPLKRAIERHLLVPLATAIVERQFPEGDQFLFIGVRGDAIDVRFVDPDADDAGGEAPPPRDFERLRARVDGHAERKAAALQEAREPGFWERPEDERARVLAEAEYLDRLQAAFETAARLVRRSDGRSSPLLAGRLLVLERACDGLDAGHPAEASLRLRPSPRTGGDGHRWAADLRAMYEAWARKRGMRLTERPDGALHVSGLGAYTILAEEAGLHVLEVPDGNGVRRVGVHVAVDGAPARRAVTRRYRREPSPLVRDARGWRSGRLDRVLGGDFDLAG